MTPSRHTKVRLRRNGGRGYVSPYRRTVASARALAERWTRRSSGHSAEVFDERDPWIVLWSYSWELTRA